MVVHKTKKVSNAAKVLATSKNKSAKKKAAKILVDHKNEKH